MFKTETGFDVTTPQAADDELWRNIVEAIASDIAETKGSDYPALSKLFSDCCNSANVDAWEVCALASMQPEVRQTFESGNRLGELVGYIESFTYNQHANGHLASARGFVALYYLGIKSFEQVGLEAADHILRMGWDTEAICAGVLGADAFLITQN